MMSMADTIAEMMKKDKVGWDVNMRLCEEIASAVQTWKINGVSLVAAV